MKPRHWIAASCVVLGLSNVLGQTSVVVGATVGNTGVAGAVNVTTPTTAVSVVGAVGSGAVNGSVTAAVSTPVVPVDPRVVPPTAAASSDARITNLSTRARVAGDSPLITGFAIRGSGPRTVLVRAVGPTLGAFGVAGALAAPRLKLHDSTGRILLENAGWGGNPMLAPATVVAGAFPFPSGSADSAVVVSLPPGTYSVEVSDDAGRGGVVLTEIYDVEKTADGSRLTNVSTRNNVAPAGGEFISGFIVSGTQPRDFLVRGVGPGLTRFSVGGVLRDPAITVFNLSGEPIATNDNWSGSPPVAASAATNIATSIATAAVAAAVANAAATVGVTVATPAIPVQATTQTAVAAATAAPIAASANVVGAFALDLFSTDAALVVTLNPGVYTVQVSASTGSGANATSGVALLEIYELP